MRQTKYTANVLFRIGFSLSLLLITVLVYGQPGCTDPLASNYDPLAQTNDGSCSYAPTSYELEFITDLPALFTETSGLAFLNNQLWTQNDAGNEDQVYRINKLTGELQQSVIVATANNVDWEDLAQSEDYLFVGDIGNNNGDRQDLVIYRIDQQDLNASVVNAEKIEFVYEDQTDFSSSPFFTNFDCEAMFFMNDSLHLFTKNWIDYKTKHYVVSAEPGQQTAFLRDSLDVQLLITAADRSANGTVILLGWNPVTGNAAFWLLFDYPPQAFFQGNKRRINLGFASQNSQPEGLVFSGTHNGYISSENFLQYPQKLLAFSTENWVSEVVSTQESLYEESITIYPNPGFGNICWENQEDKLVAIQLFDLQGQLKFQKQISDQQCVDLPLLANGLYLIEFQLEGRIIRKTWMSASSD